LMGGTLIAAGNFSLATPGYPTFYLGLLLIVLGTGLLKPNVSAIVGDLYADDTDGGARRDAGFSIFYMGINVGAFVAPLICGYLGETINWHLGFAAAGVGMVLGLIQYRFGYGYLRDAGLYRDEARATRGEAIRKGLFGVAVVALIAAAIAFAARAGFLNVTLDGAARAALKDHGTRTVRALAALPDAALAAIAEDAGIDSDTLHAARAWARLARLKGLGNANVARLWDLGIRSTGDLARQDPADLAARLGEPLTERRLRVWVRAAGRASPAR